MVTQDASQQILTLSSDTFRAFVLNREGPIAVELMSYGCSHCRAIEPVLQKVAAVVDSKERIFRVKVGAEQDLASTYAIDGTPTVASVMTAVTQPFKS